jgi:hypothetical protein
MYMNLNHSQSNRYPHIIIISTALAKLSSKINIAHAQSPEQNIKNGAKIK